MRGLINLMLIEFKLFLREPEAFFFTLIFPLIMLFVFGSIYGNTPTEYFGGRGMVDVSVPAYMGLIVAITGLMGIPISVATDREKRVLRRLRATPVRPQTILTAWVVVYLAVTLVGALLLIVAGKLVYGLRFEGNALNVFLAFTLSTLAFLAVGFVIASLAPTGRTANIVGMVLFFPMIFFSGATIPWQELPEGVRTVGYALPLTHVVQLLQGLWFAEAWSDHLVKVAVLIVTLIIGVVISARTFRWE
jgi:ABC-2 type transport system permease protein